MKHLLKLLEFLGLISCAHKWSKWSKPESYTFTSRSGGSQNKSIQTRTCDKCTKMQYTFPEEK